MKHTADSEEGLTVLLTDLYRREKTKLYILHTVVQNQEGKTDAAELTVLESYLPQGLPPVGEDGMAKGNPFPVLLSLSCYEALLYGNGVTAAIAKGADLLNLQDQTGRAIYDKLHARGFQKEEALEAVRYLTKKGMLRERDYLPRYMHYLCEHKYLGRGRMVPELLKKGFNLSAYRDIYEETLSELDFSVPLEKRIRKIGIDRFADGKERQKHYGALLRGGFTASEIRTVLEQLKEEEDTLF